MDLRRVVTIIALVLPLAAAGRAEAGRSHFGWVYGAESQPERGVELETWLIELDDLGDDKLDETLWWFGPVIGITDRLELAVPVEVTWTRSDTSLVATQLARVGAELRWRLADPDPVEAPPLVPALRLGVKRLSLEREAIRVDGDAILAFDQGPVHIAANAGLQWIAREELEDTIVARGAFGISVEVVTDLRLGVEAITELTVRNELVDDWVAVGPDVGWTHGRFWLAAAAMIGVHQVDLAPRITWGVAF